MRRGPSIDGRRHGARLTPIAWVGSSQEDATFEAVLYGRRGARPTVTPPTVTPLTPSATPELAEKLAGQWVTLNSDESVTHGFDATDVIRRARALEYSEPFVEYLYIRDPKVAWIF